MILPHRLTAELIAQAREAAPSECCGIIGTKPRVCPDCGGSGERFISEALCHRCDGEGEIPAEAVKLYPARNVAANPTITYEMDGVDQYGIAMELDHAGLELGAIYHSHPAGPAYPSGVDVATAYYPDAVYVIVGFAASDVSVVRGFRIVDGEVTEEKLGG